LGPRNIQVSTCWDKDVESEQKKKKTGPNSKIKQGKSNKCIWDLGVKKMRW